MHSSVHHASTSTAAAGARVASGSAIRYAKNGVVAEEPLEDSYSKLTFVSSTTTTAARKSFLLLYCVALRRKGSTRRLWSRRKGRGWKTQCNVHELFTVKRYSNSNDTNIPISYPLACPLPSPYVVIVVGGPCTCSTIVWLRSTARFLVGICPSRLHVSSSSSTLGFPSLPWMQSKIYDEDNGNEEIVPCDRNTASCSSSEQQKRFELQIQICANVLLSWNSIKFNSFPLENIMPQSIQLFIPRR